MSNRLYTLPVALVVLLGTALPAQAAAQPDDASAPILLARTSGPVGVLLGLFLLVMCGAWVVGMWIIFEREGESGFSALIPIYNIIVLCRITGNPEWWVLLCFVPFGGLFVLTYCYISLATNYGKSVGFGIGMALLPFVFVPILVWGDQLLAAAHRPKRKKKKSRREYDDDEDEKEDERPSRRRIRDDDDDRPRSKRRRDDDDEEEEPPRSRPTRRRDAGDDNSSSFRSRLPRDD